KKVHQVPFYILTQENLPKSVKPFDEIVFQNFGMLSHKDLYLYDTKAAFFACDHGRATELKSFNHLGEKF
ncbi:unnamed protein product, partial [Closterium sp. NIES-64]